MKTVWILVEGQTEEQFVKKVLAPVFWEHELFFHPEILEVKRWKDGTSFRGGVTTYVKFHRHLQDLLVRDPNAMVTTLLDFYGLPDDFPGMANRPKGTAQQRVRHVEAAIAASFGSPPNFLPFLALHEFEAYLFSDPDELPKTFNDPEKQAQFAAIRAEFATPEDISENPTTSPSHRIADLFPSYRKVKDGPIVASRIGLGRIRAECPHFAAWLTKLEAFAASR